MDAKKVPIIPCYNECQKDKSIEYSEKEQNIKNDNNIYKRRKTVPKLIHKWLTPRALAYWYMDDGAHKWKGKSLGVRFCTDSFTLSEIDRLTIILREKYTLKVSIQKKGKASRIYISSQKSPILKKYIFDFLIPGMISRRKKHYCALRNHDCASFVLLRKTITIIIGSKGSNHDLWQKRRFS